MAIKIELKGITNGMETKEDWLSFSRACGRVCYTEKDFEQVLGEQDKSGLIERTLKSGHHSLFEHINLTFYFSGIPKILAMIFNNEKQYATSEKSARYTVMRNIPAEQKELYDKWIGILIPEIDRFYPATEDLEARTNAIKKLAQENARYMTSVFTPTKMVHTLNLRQLNFILKELMRYGRDNKNSANKFQRRLAGEIPEVLEHLKDFKIDGLENQTDRHLSMFNFDNYPEHFSDVYSTKYFLSFAGLAQAQRHRTITYNMQTPGKNQDYGFFVPAIVKQAGLVSDWVRDLKKAAGNDFPQAQMVYVRERGTLEDFRSKCILRLCGHAQYEIMQNVKAIAKKYAKSVDFPDVSEWINPKCAQQMACIGKCVWGGKKALERIV